MPGYKSRSVSQKFCPGANLYLSNSHLRITLLSLSEEDESDSESELEEVDSEFLATAEPKANQPSNKIRKQKQLSSYVTLNSSFHM